MKTSFLTIVLVAQISLIQGQEVPNGNFESWVDTPGFYLDPEFWTTDNGQILLSTDQDSASYQGNWSMKVMPLPTETGQEGKATIEMPLDNIPSSLSFYAKWDRTENAEVEVSLIFYNNGIYLNEEEWSPDAFTSEWTQISIPLTQTLPIISHVVIKVEARVLDLEIGKAWISVDAMSFDGATGVDDIETSDLRVYPNPTADMLYLEDAGSNAIYTIYDSTGRLLSSDMYQLGIDVSTFSAGNYFIEINTAEGILRRTGFVVE